MSVSDQTAKGPARDLTTAPIGMALLLFALPTLGSSILQSASGSIDAVWVGRLISSDALAATTNGNLVMMLMSAFVFGFGIAATILVGQAVGRHNIDAARVITGTTLGAFVPGGIVVAMIGWYFAPDILYLLGTPEDIHPLAKSYLQLTFLAMPGVTTLTILMMAMRGSGDSVTPLIFMAVAVILNACFNPVLIAGLGPIPAYGVGGSALSTALANYLSLAAMLAYIYRRDLPLRLRGQELRYLLPDPRILRLIFTKGLPMGIQMIVVSSAMLTMMTLVNRQGADTAAAFGATQQLWTYVQMPAIALGAAVSAMVAQNIGAGHWDRVDRISRLGTLFTLAMTGFLILMLMLADRQAMQVFLGANHEAVAIGEHIARLGTWGFLAFGVSMVIFGTVRANGQVVWPVIILFISIYPVRLGFVIAMEPLIGTDALWLSFPVGMVTSLLMAIALYMHGGWRSNRSMQIDPVESHADSAVVSKTSEVAPALSVSAPYAQHVPLKRGTY